MSTWYAKSLYEYVQIIECISDRYKKQSKREKGGGKEENRDKEEERSLLWFRGQEQTDQYYYLEPNIYRNISSGNEKNKVNSQGTYGTLWLKEEYRYQHFAARNYDKISNMPESMIEWQEVMQHYFSKTRLMDWSESAIVALNFALEAQINPQEDHEVLYRRRHNSPVIWVLNPVMLNEKVYECFEINEGLIRKAMTDIAAVDEIITGWKRDKELYFLLENDANAGVNRLVSLSGLEFLRKCCGQELQQAVENRRFNPFFYLLLRYYSDGLAVRMDELTPLAIIHPPHSPRIHEQKGAFTVFPYYVEEETKHFAMEFMPRCMSCLDKIIIMDADRVAGQLKEMGVRRSHIYPEMEIVTKDFEYMK